METQLIELFRWCVGLSAGGLIGYAFGRLQEAALRRHVGREQAGRLTNGWSLMPGAGGRVALLLLVLTAIQIVCPLLFVDGTQWIVCAGVGIGYGVELYRNLRHRITGRS